MTINPNEIWNEAWLQRPINHVLERDIDITIVGSRCVYINDHRVQGGKPYVSENLSHDVRKTKLREVLDAFTVEKIKAYLEHKISHDAFCHGLRSFRDAIKETA